MRPDLGGESSLRIGGGDDRPLQARYTVGLKLSRVKRFLIKLVFPEESSPGNPIRAPFSEACLCQTTLNVYT